MITQELKCEVLQCINHVMSIGEKSTIKALSSNNRHNEDIDKDNDVDENVT